MSVTVQVGTETADRTASNDAVSHRSYVQILGDKVRRFPGLLWRSTCNFGGVLRNCLGRLAQRVEKVVDSWWHTSWEVGEEDHRRVIHALKVGVAIALVSQLYLIEALYERFGESAMVAVLTVAVVLEFTAGSTFCKGVNRGFGTFLAGFLALTIEYISDVSGHIFRAVFISIVVFLVGAGSTYVRFFPSVMKHYDDGVVIFLLTFNLITISSYRVDNVLGIAKEKVFSISIAVGICVCMTLLIFPIWSGHDLHNSTVTKLEGLAKSIEACAHEYFNDNDNDTEEVDEDSYDTIYEGYKVVLDSKTKDETLADYAKWEPRHAKYKVPFKQYVKLGTVLRKFGYSVFALHGCLETEIQTPKSIRAVFKDPCIRLATEVSKVFTELASSVKNRRQCSPEILSDHLQKALEDLHIAMKSQPRLFIGSNKNDTDNMLAEAAAHETLKQEKQTKPSLTSVETDSTAMVEGRKKRENHSSASLESEAKRVPEVDRRTLRPQLSKMAIMSLEFSEALPFACFASLLVEIVARLDSVIDEVEELGRVAQFKEFTDRITVTCERPSEMDSHLPSQPT